MNLFDYSACLIGKRLQKEDPIYNVLPKLKELIEQKGKALGSDYVEAQPQVWVHKTADVSTLAVVLPPTIICEGAVVRPRAYIRGGVIVGKNAVVGAGCEIKNSILFDGAQVPHLSYVGDSILGAGAHFGAGVIASNLRLDGKNVSIRQDGKKIDTGLRKFGALVGDGAQIGCNAVLCPGTIVEAGAFVMPLQCICGTINKIRSNK